MHDNCSTPVYLCVYNQQEAQDQLNQTSGLVCNKNWTTKQNIAIYAAAAVIMFLSELTFWLTDCLFQR